MTDILLGSMIPTHPADSTPILEQRVVVFTDIVASTSLIDRHGDDAWIAVLTSHLRSASILATEYGGEFVKSTGDGTLAVFDDCGAAAGFARAMADATRHSGGSGAGITVELRIGMACGKVHRWQDDYFGRTVHLAARICAAAEPGEILMSSTCLEACAALRMTTGARRAMRLRGFSDIESVCPAAAHPGHRTPVLA